MIISLPSCGKWIPGKHATMAEAYPDFDIDKLMIEAPQAAIRKKDFNFPPGKVYAAVIKVLESKGLTLIEKNDDQKVLFIQGSRWLEAPPDLLNCPNNHYANIKKQAWIDYMAATLESKDNGTTSLTFYTRTQGRCYKSDNCYGTDPCPAYAELHWAVGYDSADQSIDQYFEAIESSLK